MKQAKEAEYQIKIFVYTVNLLVLCTHMRDQN